MDLVAQLVVWLNVVANLLGEWLLAPVAYLPGWVSVTLVSAATGVLFLIGIVTSGVVGYLAIAYFVRYLTRHSLALFAWYRLALAAAVMVWLWRAA